MIGSWPSGKAQDFDSCIGGSNPPDSVGSEAQLAERVTVNHLAAGSIPARSVCTQGSMAEWFKAPVLKTGLPQGNVGSNPTASVLWAGGRAVKAADCKSVARKSVGGSNPSLPIQKKEREVLP